MSIRYCITSRITSLTIPTITTIDTLSLHDALPIYPTVTNAVQGSTVATYNNQPVIVFPPAPSSPPPQSLNGGKTMTGDRKSTRLNSSHLGISYAVFGLKKKIDREPDA